MDRSHFVLEAALDGLSWVHSDRERTKNPRTESKQRRIRDPERAEKEWSGVCVDCNENRKKVATAAAAQARAVDPIMTEADITATSFFKQRANGANAAVSMRVMSDAHDDREH